MTKVTEVLYMKNLRLCKVQKIYGLIAGVESGELKNILNVNYGRDCISLMQDQP